MNVKTILLSSAFIISAACGKVSAAENYFGGGLALVDYSESGLSEDASLAAVFGKFGKKFSENISGEVRFGIGLVDDSVGDIRSELFSIDLPLLEIELENYYGLYIKSGISVIEGFYPYAILGYTRGKLKISAFDESTSVSESGTSFGLGADFTISENLDVSIEYMNYFDKDEARLGGFSLSFTKSIQL